LLAKDSAATGADTYFLSKCNHVLTSARHSASKSRCNAEKYRDVLASTLTEAFLFGRIGFGVFFFGWLSDFLGPRFGAESLRYSILIGLVFYVLAATLLYLASRRLERGWYR